MTDEYRGNLRKYQSPNPVVRLCIERFLRRLVSRVKEERPRRVVDLGCGEGFVAGRLQRRCPEVDYLGIDRAEPAIRFAREACPGLRFIQGDFLEPSLATTGDDLLLCLEVLEHQHHPREVLSRIAALPQRAAVFSVPWEPFFRAGNLLRLHHLRRLGSAPGHVQAFDRGSFVALVQEGYARVELEVSFPWLLIVARGAPA